MLVKIGFLAVRLERVAVGIGLLQVLFLRLGMEMKKIDL
jgi:hypothetical protein